MTPRIVVHAGMPKTGTSALQKWLHGHRAELAEVGVLYPEHTLDANGVSSGNREALLKLEGDRFVVSSDAVTDTLDTLSNSEADRLLLSSEFFGVAIPELEQSLPTDASFVVYLRSPIEFLESDYNQWVKRGGRTEAFAYERPEPGRGVGHLDAILRACQEPERTIVRAYHSSTFVGGNLLTDLFSAAALPIPHTGLGEFGRVNLSYTLPALEFKRAANVLPLAGIAPRLDRVLQRCTVGVSEFSLIPPEAHRDLKDYALAELGRVLAVRDSESIQELYQLVQSDPGRPYFMQAATSDELRAVAEFVAAEDPSVALELGRLAAAESDLSFPHEEFSRIVQDVAEPQDALPSSPPHGRFTRLFRR